MLREHQWQVARIAVPLPTGRNLRPVQDAELFRCEAKDEVARKSTGIALDLLIAGERAGMHLSVSRPKDTGVPWHKSSFKIAAFA
jgi:hypothetical protein